MAKSWEGIVVDKKYWENGGMSAFAGSSRVMDF